MEGLLCDHLHESHNTAASESTLSPCLCPYSVQTIIETLLTTKSANSWMCRCYYSTCAISQHQCSLISSSGSCKCKVLTVFLQGDDRQYTLASSGKKVTTVIFLLGEILQFYNKCKKNSINWMLSVWVCTWGSMFSLWKSWSVSHDCISFGYIYSRSTSTNSTTCCRHVDIFTFMITYIYNNIRFSCIYFVWRLPSLTISVVYSVLLSNTTPQTENVNRLMACNLTKQKINNLTFVSKKFETRFMLSI